MKATLGLSLLVVLCAMKAFLAEDRPKTGIKVAVLEHDRRPYESTPVETMLGNARVFVENAAKAAQQGAKLIVFPEYAIFGSGDFPPDQIDILNWYYIYLPDEAIGTWNPCKEPKKFHGPQDPGDTYKVLETLSCGAQNNSIVLIVNALTKRLCSSNTSACGKDGYQTFNTNVFFGANGTIIAVYHKRYLYHEDNVQPAPHPEYIIVDIDGIQFGTFICFDMIFEPAFEYVTKLGIRNLIFSTAWMNELPFMTAPQIYKGYARGLGVNLVVANEFGPKRARLGSGIYSSSLGALTETYDISTPGRLLIAELPVDPLPVPEDSFACDFSVPEQNQTTLNSSSYQKFILTDVPTSSVPLNKTHKIVYQPLQNFTHQLLNSDKDLMTLCSGDLCCQLEYEFSSRDDTIYAFVIANNLRYLSKYPFYQQVCSVLRCESEDIETCGRLPEKPTSTQFSSLNLTGSFATSAILPSVTGTDLQSFPASSWSFSKGECSDSNRFKTGGKISLSQSNSKDSVMVVSLYGRVFDRD